MTVIYWRRRSLKLLEYILLYFRLKQYRINMVPRRKELVSTLKSFFVWNDGPDQFVLKKQNKLFGKDEMHNHIYCSSIVGFIYDIQNKIDRDSRNYHSNFCPCLLVQIWSTELICFVNLRIHLINRPSATSVSNISKRQAQSRALRKNKKAIQWCSKFASIKMSQTKTQIFVSIHSTLLCMMEERGQLCTKVYKKSLWKKKQKHQTFTLWLLDEKKI